MIIAITNISVNISFSYQSSVFAVQGSFNKSISLDSGSGNQVHALVPASSENNVHVLFNSGFYDRSSTFSKRSIYDGGAMYRAPDSASNDLRNGLFSFLNNQNGDTFKIKNTETAGGGTVSGNTLNTGNNPHISSNPPINKSGSYLGLSWPLVHWDSLNIGGFKFDSRPSTSTVISIPTSDSTLHSVIDRDLAKLHSVIDYTWNVFGNNYFTVLFPKSILTSNIYVEDIHKLIESVNRLPIAKEAKSSLNGPLYNAIKVLMDSDPSNDADVCSMLNSFMSQVNSEEGNQQLTSQQAEILRQQDKATETSLICSSTTTTAATTLIINSG